MMEAEAYERGCELFKLDPTLTLVEVWHHAVRLFADREQQDQFVSAYIASRMRRDEFQRERQERQADQ
jgi:hypothetical protein